ncbi:MAG: hypothetical protein PF495_21095 [Spirochaetales bacterium]|jgi:hypothetical protein|nr:hypothetical protein [Spirochaetales bacterium]
MSKQTGTAELVEAIDRHALALRYFADQVGNGIDRAFGGRTVTTSLDQQEEAAAIAEVAVEPVAKDPKKKKDAPPIGLETMRLALNTFAKDKGKDTALKVLAKYTKGGTISFDDLEPDQYPTMMEALNAA